MKNKNKKISHCSVFNIHYSSAAFTLIELLVVISIIGILAAFGFSRYTLAEKQARDAQRKSDLNQYRIALENYSVANNLIYPQLACGGVDVLCAFGTPSFQSTYLSGSCLQDPRPLTSVYNYCSDSVGTQYVVFAKLETGDYFQVCSGGRSGKTLTVPTSSTCNP